MQKDASNKTVTISCIKDIRRMFEWRLRTSAVKNAKFISQGKL